ncbi:MAG: serine hydrolase domain-containing protein [Oligoflexus sp.]
MKISRIWWPIILWFLSYPYSGFGACEQVSHEDQEWPASLPAHDQADQELLSYIKGVSGREDSQSRNWESNALIIVHKNELMLEYYAHGYDASRKHLLWSITKSILNALVGIAVGEGKISLNQSLAHYLPDFPQLSTVTIDHLMAFSSGINWNETYENSLPHRSSVMAILYANTPRSIKAALLPYQLKNAPGKQWSYSSGDSFWLALVLQAVYGESYHGMPWQKLFEPLGITSATLESDHEGTFYMSSYGYMTARDLVRFGLLYLHGGCINGQALLPQRGDIPESPDLSWVEWSMEPSKALLDYLASPDAEPGQGGRHFWLNLSKDVSGQTPPYPSAPSDILVGMGHWGQRIYILPAWDMVVVRLGNDRTTEYWDDEGFLQHLSRWKEAKR